MTTLRCDVCGLPINGPRDGMVYWRTSGGSPPVVDELRVAHRGPCDERGAFPNSWNLSRLVERYLDLTESYRWPEELLRRLASVAAAVDTVAK